jgi:hypothetical protein
VSRDATAETAALLAAFKLRSNTAICALSEDVRAIWPPVSLRGGAVVIAAADWIGRDRVIERPSEGLIPWLIRTGKALE